MKTPFLLHIPHASTRIPEEYREDYFPGLEEEVKCMTDWYTDELFDLPASRLVFPVSRLVCDVERFRDDYMEEMSRCGMGACYTKGHDGKPLRYMDARKKEAILRRWYDPHHAFLTEMAAESLKRFGVCTIVDCHSFSAVPLPYEPDQKPNRPDICIGTDAYHTPRKLSDILIDAFYRRGYSVTVNAPYSGTMVPLTHFHTDPRIRSVMIEVNRRLYLDCSCRKLDSFPRVKQDIAEIFNDILNGESINSI